MTCCVESNKKLQVIKNDLGTRLTWGGGEIDSDSRLITPAVV